MSELGNVKNLASSTLSKQSEPVLGSMASTQAEEPIPERPEMDIFKSIFSASSSSSESDEETVDPSEAAHKVVQQRTAVPSQHGQQSSGMSEIQPTTTSRANPIAPAGPTMPNMPVRAPEPAAKLTLVHTTAIDIINKAQQKTIEQSQSDKHGESEWVEISPDVIATSKHKHKKSKEHKKKSKHHKKHKVVESIKALVLHSLHFSTKSRLVTHDQRANRATLRGSLLCSMKPCCSGSSQRAEFRLL